MKSESAPVSASAPATSVSASAVRTISRPGSCRRACPPLALVLAGAIGLSLAASMPAVAQTKVAVIDLKRVFDGYYKTKLADSQLKERGADMLKVRKGMIEDYQKANEEYRKLMESSKDPALSAEEKDKRTKSAEAKLREIQEIEESVKKFDQQSSQTMQEQQQRMRDNILREIKEVVDARAKAAGFALVIDTVAESFNRTPVVIFNSGENDLTQETLTKLNATAPPSLQKTEEKPDAAAPAEGKKADDKK